MLKISVHRCAGREVDEGRCCTKDNPCQHGEGDCDSDQECQGDLICGDNNCKQFAAYFHPKDDCCVKPDVKVIDNSVYGKCLHLQTVMLLDCLKNGAPGKLGL